MYVQSRSQIYVHVVDSMVKTIKKNNKAVCLFQKGFTFKEIKRIFNAIFNLDLIKR